MNVHLFRIFRRGGRAAINLAFSNPKARPAYGRPKREHRGRVAGALVFYDTQTGMEWDLR